MNIIFITHCQRHHDPKTIPNIRLIYDKTVFLTTLTRFDNHTSKCKTEPDDGDDDDTNDPKSDDTWDSSAGNQSPATGILCTCSKRTPTGPIAQIITCSTTDQ